jgi:hypothetical protein
MSPGFFQIRSIFRFDNYVLIIARKKNRAYREIEKRR